MVIPPNFNELPEVEKFRMVLNKPENVKYTGQFVIKPPRLFKDSDIPVC